MASSALDILIKAKDEAAAVFRSLSAELNGMHGHATNVQGSMRGAGQSTEQAGVAASSGGMSFGRLAGAFTLALVGVQALEGGVRVGIDVVEKIATAAENSINSFVDFGVSIKTLQTEFGLSAQSASVLTDMFKRFDDITGASENSLGLFAKNMNTAAEGTGAAAKVFERLGVEVKNSDGSLRGLDDILPQVASALSKETDGTQKAADAKALFGRAGLNLIPMLQQLATQGLGPTTEEFKSMGLVMDQAGVDKAYTLKLGMIGVKEQVQGLGVAIGGALAPVVQNLIDDLQVWIIQQGGVHGVMQKLAPILQEAVVGVGGLLKTMGDGIGILVSFGTGFSYIVQGVLAAVAPWTLFDGSVRDLFSHMRSGLKDIGGIGDAVKNLGGDIQQYGTNMFKDMSTTIQGQLRSLPSVVSGAFQSAGIEAKLAAGTSVAQILAEFKNLPPDVQAYLLTLPQATSLNIKAAGDQGSATAAKTVEMITHHFATLPPEVQAYLSHLDPAVQTELGKAAATSNTTAAQAVVNYLRQIGQLPPEVEQKLQGVVDATTNKGSAAANQADYFGNLLAGNFGTGAGQAGPNVASGVSGVTPAVQNEGDKATQTASAAGIGISTALGDTTQQAHDRVYASLQRVGGAVTEALGPAAIDAYNEGVAIMENLQSGIDSHGPAHIPAPVQDHATGGYVAGYATGGPVYLAGGGDGWGQPHGTDTIRAWLTPGEFVMRREAVDRVGAAYLNALNSGDRPETSGHGRNTTIHQTNHNYYEADLELANRELGWRLAVA